MKRQQAVFLREQVNDFSINQDSKLILYGLWALNFLSKIYY